MIRASALRSDGIFSRQSPAFFPLLAAAFLLISLERSQAVTVFDATAANTTNPGNFAWNNIGQLNGASIIYLGDIANNNTYWVITAAHVAGSLPGTVQLNGTESPGMETYNTVSGSFVQLTNTGLTGFGVLPTNADLVMFQIDISGGATNLINLTIANTLPANTEDIYMVGYGGGKSWGTNRVEIGAVAASTTSGTNISFRTDWDSTTGEAQAITGDSGGAVFTLDGSLIGMMFAVDTAPNPDLTYSADLTKYKAKIVAIATSAVPEPGTWALLSLGLGFGLAAFRFRRLPCSR